MRNISNKIAPTLSAITLKRSKSISREYAEAPAIINLVVLWWLFEFYHNLIVVAGSTP
jgi:hypothetical protein